MIRPLSVQQFNELWDFLGYDPSLEGLWSLTPPSGPCIYAINSKGNKVIRLSCYDKRGARQKCRQSAFSPDLGGYFYASINNKGVKVHRLVAEVWLSNYDKSLTVNHRDGNHQNNDFHNLEMMTSEENVSYYHTSNHPGVVKQRQQDYMYHGTTIQGRIHITNGVKGKMIYESEGIPEGWWKGRPQTMKDKCSQALTGRIAHNAGKTSITDGKTVKWINLNESVPEGWHYGYTFRNPDQRAEQLRQKMSNRIYITKDKVNKRVYASELPEYISKGWRVGMYSKRSENKE